MLLFLFTLFACGEDESEDTSSEDTAVETSEEATIRYH